MFKKSVIAAIAVAALGTQAGHAATATVQVNGSTSLSVTATVNASCTAAQQTAVAFPAITSTAADIVATGNVLVTCDVGTPYALGLDLGGSAVGSQRRMNANFGTTFLPYKLYVDAGHTTEYTDILLGVTGSTLNAPASSTPGSIGVAGGTAFAVNGLIPAGTAKPAPGNYTDSVAIHVGY